MIFEKFILNYYKNFLLTRHDPNGKIFYFSKEDFDGLSFEQCDFLGNKGQKLFGGFYFRGEKRYDRLVVFEHGMGCGHAAYMREVNYLTERGFTVYAYDHTGTYRSEGEHIGGFSQSLADLDKAISMLESHPEYKDADISVIGHSWGGFSTMNIAALHPKISHVVPMSGFISPKAIQAQFFKGFLKYYRKAMFNVEQTALPEYCEFDGRKSLAESGVKALVIHSRDDSVVSFEQHFDALRSALSGCENVEFIPLDGKCHNPNYTKEAVANLRAFNADLKQKNKKKLLKTDEAKAEFRASYDWLKITDQDEEIWDKIIEFLDK